MPLENRDYARREANEPGWTTGVQWLVFASVAAYLAAFIASRASPRLSPHEIVATLGLVPSRAVTGRAVWQFVTYAFVHDARNPFHLIANMYLVWVAGRAIESELGSARLLKLFAAGTMFTALVYAAASALVPDLRFLPLTGAAGGALALLLVHASRRPNERILVFFFFEAPAWAGVPAMGGVALLMTAYAGEAGAFAAGAAVLGGAIAFFAHRLREHLEAVLVAKTRAASRPARRPQAPPLPAPSPQPSLEDELDLVLEKIHEKGMGGLTDQERGVLERASRHYRSKR